MYAIDRACELSSRFLNAVKRHKMGAKEDLLADLIRHDRTGSVQRIHDKFIEHGLKWKGPSNSQTLLYLFRLDGREMGVAAMRRGILSFPTTFWSARTPALRRALNRVASYQQVTTEPAISSSQYSAGQIQVSESTLEAIEEIIEEIVIPEARQAGAKLA
ncbi:hypothetical protein [Candidatus Accumulibacter sp. ACC012]|uniref:hypothetical protein n=1 Tax=Candidatus Accumulibacter sp. ACC012 TaxID=2823332 RepID=UPI0025B83910|nr:hypothetical protein [Candidatus Accumulibacter sp. ACC012]